MDARLDRGSPLNVRVLFPGSGKALASHSLGTRLKAERERRGLTLAQISASTKIPLTLLQALERDDCARWPKGLYRRAFFRSYVTALGLQAEPFVREFARLFPDDTSSAQPLDEFTTIDPEPAAADQPLALSWAGPSPTHRLLRSVAIALVEVGAVASVGGVLAWTSGMHLVESIGAVALVYLPGVRMAAGRTRRWHPVRDRASDTERGQMLRPHSSELAVPGHPAATVRTAAILERCRPVAARIAEVAGRLAVERISGTRSFLARSGRAAGAGVAAAARHTRRVSSRGFAEASHAFWTGVRSAAGYAALLANRQLNRTQD